jgi:acetyl-CoA synthetase
LAAVGEQGRVAMDLAQSPLAWFRGYIENRNQTEEKFSSDGRWYITGDTGHVDKDGYFYFSARDDDVIIMAGYRIGPSDVETVLLAHPAVAECAVFAVPDEIRGEVLSAAVALQNKQRPTEELTAQLQEWVKNRYAAHAYPRHIYYLDQLPKTPSGKIQRFVLRERFRA